MPRFHAAFDGFCVCISSIMAIPICYLTNMILTNDELHLGRDASKIIVLVGFLVLAGVVLLVYAGFISNQKLDSEITSVTPLSSKKNGLFLYLVFTICCFSSVVDLLLALENDGIVSGFLEFYLKDGEPYLRSAHGSAICYWDGTVHYVLYIYMLGSLAKRRDFSWCGLVWVGSIINSLLVLLPGGIAGPYKVKPSFLLNVPYCIVPIWSASLFLSAARFSTQKDAPRETLCKKPVDMLIVLCFTIATVIAFFRGFVALGCCEWYVAQFEPYLGDPVFFPKMQMLVYLFYYVPYYMFSIYGTVSTSDNSASLAKLSLIFAGAAAQGQFSHVVASFHHLTSIEYRSVLSEQYHFASFITNVGLLIGPLLIAYHMVSQLLPYDNIDTKVKEN